MSAGRTSAMSWEEAQKVLGVAVDADEAQIRVAYLEKVRQHPPDRDPEQFERVRDAYELLKDPAQRARQVLAGPDPQAPLMDFLEGRRAERRFVGSRGWLDVLKEKRQ